MREAVSGQNDNNFLDDYSVESASVNFSYNKAFFQQKILYTK